MGRKIESIGKYKFCYTTLGKGSFGRVELVVHELTKCKVAMKIINTRNILEDYVRNNLYREARILSQLNHPNIIKFYESLKADMYYCVVLECASGGELSEYMRTFTHHRLPEEAARHYMRQLVSAIQYMHERQVVHRDLKMDNLMLDKTKKHLKIIDFGLSNNLTRNSLLSTHCGSPEYAAPELFVSGSSYGPEVDIWSLGIVFYIMVVGVMPFNSPYYDHARKQRLLAVITKGLNDKHTKEMEHLTKDCQNLIKDMIEPLSHLRIPIDDVTDHPWISEQGTKPFTPYFVKPKNPDIKAQIIEKLSEVANLNKVEVERSVYENGTNELSAMFKMLLEEAKQEAGFYEEDHTSRPNELVTERRRYLAQAKWRRLRCRLKESARLFKEHVHNKQQQIMAATFQDRGVSDPEMNDGSSCNSHCSLDLREEAILQNIEAKKKKQPKPKPRVNPVGIVKTEKKKEFFPQKRSFASQIAAGATAAGSDDASRRKSGSPIQSNRRSRTSNRSKHMHKSNLAINNFKSSQDEGAIPNSSSVTMLNKKRQTSAVEKPNKEMETKKSENNLNNKGRKFNTDESENLHELSSSASAINKLPWKSRLPPAKSVQRSINDTNIVQAPLAKIEEIQMATLEAAGILIQECEPRYCLVKITDGEMSSGVMLSSTMSEVSNESLCRSMLQSEDDSQPLNQETEDDNSKSGGKQSKSVTLVRQYSLFESSDDDNGHDDKQPVLRNKEHRDFTNNTLSNESVTPTSYTPRNSQQFVCNGSITTVNSNINKTTQHQNNDKEHTSNS